MSEKKDHIQDMSDEDFEQNKQSLAEKRLEKPKKLSQQTEKYWWEISSQQYNYDRDNIEVEELKKITKDEVLQFHEEMISYSSPLRHKLSVHILSTAPQGPEQAQKDTPAPDGLIPTPDLPKSVIVEEVATFKRSLGLFPLVKPYIHIPKPICTAKSKL